MLIFAYLKAGARDADTAPGRPEVLPHDQRGLDGKDRKRCLACLADECR